MLSSVLGRVMPVSDSQYVKVSLPIFFRVEGKTMPFSFLHHSKARVPISVSPSGRLMLSRFSHLPKAKFPIKSIVSGSCTPVIAVLLASPLLGSKAPPLIFLTIQKSLTIPGTSTYPPGPV